MPFDGPGLPVRFRFEGVREVECAWPAATIRWWGKVRTMPHAKDWTPTDWEFAFAAAEIHARIVEGGKGWTELRQRERLLGMYADARAAMRIRYVAPSTASKLEAEAGPAIAANVIPVDFAQMYEATS